MEDKSQKKRKPTVSFLRYFAISVSVIILTVILFALALPSGATVGNGASVDIISYNLSYYDRVNIAYAVDVNGAEASEVEMLFWYEKPSSPTDTPAYKDTTYSVAYRDNGEVRFPCVFFSDGIAPKESARIVYAAAHIKNTNIYSAVERYSALEYIYERQNTPGISELQANLYSSFLSYARDIQLLLDHNPDALPQDYVYLTFDGGFDEEGYSRGIYKTGSTLSLSAASYDGGSISWVNGNGETIGSGSEIEIVVGNSHDTIRAVSDVTVSTVGGEIDIEGGVATVGAKATLTAPVSRKAGDNTEYFSGWYTSGGTLISKAARCEITVEGSEIYTARYSSLSEFDNYSHNDFSTGFGSVTNNSDRKADSYEAPDGYVTITSIRKSTSITSTSLSATYKNLNTAFAKIFSLELNLPSRDFDGDDNGGDGNENELRGDFFTTTGKTELYKLSIKTGSNVILDLVIIVTVSDGYVTGYNLALASAPEVKLLRSDISLGTNASLTFEIAASADGTEAVACNIYVDGAYEATVQPADGYDSDADLTFSFGTTNYTLGYVYLDDFIYRESAI